MLRVLGFCFHALTTSDMPSRAWYSFSSFPSSVPLELTQLAAEQPIVQLAGFMLRRHLGVTVVCVKYLSRQFYIDLMTGNFQVLEMAPGDVIGVLRLLVIHISRIHRDAGNDVVRGHHIKDIQVFNDRAGKAGVLVVAFVITASNFNVRGVKGNNSFVPEVVNPMMSLAAVSTQDS